MFPSVLPLLKRGLPLKVSLPLAHRTMNTWLALGTTRKGNLSAMDYFNKMKVLGDEMVVAGRPLDDEELIEYIITKLDEEYTPLVSVICARVEPISLIE
jgi:hypothetical protein